MNKTVVAKLKGGLGNQLFIYFAAASLAERNGAKLVIETGEIGNAETFRTFGLNNLILPVPFQVIEPRFNFRNKVLRKVLRELRNLRHLVLRDYIHTSEEVGFVDLNNLRSSSGSIYLDAYYQSWRYFADLEVLQGAIVVQPKVKSNSYVEHMERMKIKNVIAVHIRRGDFLKFKDSIGVLNLDYYRDALLEVKHSNPNSEVWAYSDDLQFIKQNQKYLGIDYIPDSASALTETETLFLMSAAKAIVTSNSTFSWWAATLSSRETKVFCPDPWHKSAPIPNELVPPSWKTVESKWM